MYVILLMIRNPKWILLMIRNDPNIFSLDLIVYRGYGKPRLTNPTSVGNFIPIMSLYYKHCKSSIWFRSEQFQNTLIKLKCWTPGVSISHFYVNREIGLYRCWWRMLVTVYFGDNCSLVIVTKCLTLWMNSKFSKNSIFLPNFCFPEPDSGFLWDLLYILQGIFPQLDPVNDRFSKMRILRINYYV